jgi:hypothetical protein
MLYRFIAFSTILACLVGDCGWPSAYRLPAADQVGNVQMGKTFWPSGTEDRAVSTVA